MLTHGLTCVAHMLTDVNTCYHMLTLCKHILSQC